MSNPFQSSSELIESLEGDWRWKSRYAILSLAVATAHDVSEFATPDHSSLLNFPGSSNAFGY